jgi:hypothetical protein
LYSSAWGGASGIVAPQLNTIESEGMKVVDDAGGVFSGPDGGAKSIVACS